MDRACAETKDWYDKNYETEGFNAQRNYPNEEVLRFLGREFFSKVPHDNRKNIKILEVGCGSCANLWMIAHEGFEAHGLDISPESLVLGSEMLLKWNVKAYLKVGNMLEMPYPDGIFDVVVDVFSSYCCIYEDFKQFLAEVQRVLRPRGLFFSYIPSVDCDAFHNHAPSEKIDAYTLDGIHRPDSPFYGNFYPFRFTDIEDYSAFLKMLNFDVTYAETVTRSYNARTEKFQHLVVVGRKNW
jgi:ubiquinone/menaquinone biosynthesis C-methylase UbiE